MYREPSFSPTDIKSDAVGASPVQALLALHRFNQDEIERMFKEMTSKEHHEIPLRKTLSSDRKEIRYLIDDDILQDFLTWSVMFLVELVERMKQYWFLLLKKPTEDELNWFYFVCGKEYVTYFFTLVEGNKANKRATKELCIEYFYQGWKDDPERIDSHIKTMEKSFPDYFTKKGVEKKLEKDDRKIRRDLKVFDSDRNKDYFLHIKNNYGWILDCIKEIIHPEFLKKMYVSKYFDSESGPN